MSVVIRPIRLEEVGILQDFVRDHWNAQHAFVRSTELLLWQHFTNPFKADSPYADDELTFLGAWEGSSLVAVLGEIPLAFTFRGRELPGTWLALWKNREEMQHASAGLQLFRHIASGPAAFVGGIGINERVRRVYGLFRFQLYYDLPLYVVLNPEVESAMVRRKPSWNEERAAQLHARTPFAAPAPGFRIATGPAETGEWDAFWARTRGELVGTDRSFAYMSWRYLTHPHYRYEWVRVYDDRGELAAAGVYRVEHARGERVLHIVEFLGNPEGTAQLARALCAAMREHSASFLGFRCSSPACFEPWREIGGDVYGSGDPAYEIPSLFQPVIPEYRPLVWAYRFSKDLGPMEPSDCYITRSDGDQDRPSQID